MLNPVGGHAPPPQGLAHSLKSFQLQFQFQFQKKQLKIDPESTPNRPRIDPESIPNRPRIDPESIPNRPRIDPESTRIDPESIPNRARIDPESIPNRSRIDRFHGKKTVSIVGRIYSEWWLGVGDSPKSVPEAPRGTHNLGGHTKPKH